MGTAAVRDMGTGVRESFVQRLIAAVLRLMLRLTLLRTFRAGRADADQRRWLARFSRLTLPPRGVRFERGHAVA